MWSLESSPWTVPLSLQRLKNLSHIWINFLWSSLKQFKWLITSSVNIFLWKIYFKTELVPVNLYYTLTQNIRWPLNISKPVVRNKTIPTIHKFRSNQTYVYLWWLTHKPNLCIFCKPSYKPNLSNFSGSLRNQTYECYQFLLKWQISILNYQAKKLLCRKTKRSIQRYSILLSVNCHDFLQRIVERFLVTYKMVYV